MNKFFIVVFALVYALSSKAQDDIYVASTGSMATFTGAEVAVFGNIINDAIATPSTLMTNAAGFNHNGGGKVYFYRRATLGTGSTRVYDGPNAVVPTSNNYNINGSNIRLYDLVTDNTTGSSVASGTNVNSTSGNGHIQIEQEVRVSNKLTFVNGNIWTPRANWKHAFLHFDSDSASYQNAATPNTSFASPSTNIHVDGYVAKSGSSNFIFPVGDGVYSRYCAIQSPSNGTFKAAYFKKNANLLTTASGISGSSTQGSTTKYNNNIVNVSTKEFWDIDGTSTAQVSLSAFNSGAYSGWNSDFSSLSNVNPSKLVIAGLDDWENLGITTAPATFNDDGFFVSGQGITPDNSGPANTNNPFVAFTWAAVTSSSSLPLKLLNFDVNKKDCTSQITWTTSNEQNIVKIDLQRRFGSASVDFENIYSTAAKGNNNATVINQYSFLDDNFNSDKDETYFYRLAIHEKDGSIKYSNTLSLIMDCKGKSGVIAYPNPTNGIINLNGFGMSSGEIIDISIYNSLGQIVMTPFKQHINYNGSFFVQMDVNFLADGLYEIMIKRNKRIEKIKIKVNH